MGYQPLNHRLTALLAGFDLNQKIGGCSLTIFHDNRCAIALAHGIAQLDRATGETKAWTPTTLSLNFSTGKGVLVTLIHVLVSEGILAYDTPIAKYWPEFAQSGKASIALREVLCHEAGLFDIRSVTDHAKDMLDWSTMLQRVAAMPISTVATDNLSASDNDKFVAYSALVSGWVLGGLIEAVTKLSLQQALEQYLLLPLDLIGQAYFGVPNDKVALVAGQMREKEEQSKPTLTQDSNETLAFYQSQPIYQFWQGSVNKQTSDNVSVLTTQAINSLYFNPAHVHPEDYKSALIPAGSRQFNYYHPATLQAKIPAANGVASSHALATIYAMLANGGVWQGQQLISSQVFDELSKIHNTLADKIMPAEMQWRLGYHRVFSLSHDVRHAFGHMGYNGATAWCDTERRLSVAFTHNYDVTMLNDVRQFLINETVLDFFD